jgi:hypothetical protein
MVDPLKSRAVLLYLSVGRSSYPKHEPEALSTAFDETESAQMGRYVSNLLKEMYAIPLDWHEHTLQSATAFIEAEMGRRHPELSPEAIAALGWDFSFSWK